MARFSYCWHVHGGSRGNGVMLKKILLMMSVFALGMDMGMGMGKEGQTLILNANNKLVSYILDNKEGENVSLMCEQLYDLALIQQAPLQPEDMTKFIDRSNKIMMLLAK